MVVFFTKSLVWLPLAIFASCWAKHKQFAACISYPAGTVNHGDIQHFGSFLFQTPACLSLVSRDRTEMQEQNIIMFSIRTNKKKGYRVQFDIVKNVVPFFVQNSSGCQLTLNAAICYTMDLNPPSVIP